MFGLLDVIGVGEVLGVLLVLVFWINSFCRFGSFGVWLRLVLLLSVGSCLRLVRLRLLRNWWVVV